MNILKIVVPICLLAGQSQADTLYDRLKGNSTVTIGFGQGSSDWTRAQFKDPLTKDVFFKSATTALNQFKGDEPKNVLFFGITGGGFNLVGTKHDFSLAVMYQGENFSDSYTCVKSYNITWALKSDDEAKIKLAVDCTNDFVEFAKTVNLE